MKKRILSFILVLSMVLGMSTAIFGDTGLKPSIVVNGKQISLESSYLDENGMLMIPLRSLLEKLNYKVKWDNDDKSVTLLKGEQEIVLKIGSKELSVNGQISKMKNTPAIKDRKTFVPVELLDKSLNSVLGWNSKNQTLQMRDIKENKEEIFMSSHDKDIQQKLNVYMKALVNNENFHGSVLVAKEGEIILSEGYGYSDFTQNIENKPQTRYSIGSVTKQFAAVSILKLSETGLLNLDDKVSKYIPDFPHGDEISIHNLLTHTSGLVNYTDLQEFLTFDLTNKEPKKILELIEDMDLVAKPGEMFQYSNTNYLLLGIIIEKITGRTFEDNLKDMVSTLGMEDTGLIYGKGGGLNDATPYVGYLEVQEIDDDLVLTQAYAAGSMYSTVEDLYRWDRAIKSHKILHEKATNEMFKEHINILGAGDYGYGWMIDDTDMGREIYHGGNTLGSTSYIGRLEDKDITIIILTNNGAYNTTKLKNDLLAITLDKEYEIPRPLKAIEIKDKELYSKYAGKYEFINGTYLDIIEDDNKLYAQATGQPAFEIFPKTTTEFFARIAEINIEFKTNEEGKATELVFNQLGIEFTCKRVKDKEEKIEVEIDPKIYDVYVGEYKLAEGVIVNITKEDDKLYSQITGQDKLEIFPSSETEFFYKVVDAKITFEKDDKGKVTSLTFSQMGRDMKSDKIK